MPDRFAPVDDFLFRGGAPDIAELPILKDIWGVKRIISLDEEVGEHIHEACEKLGLEHIQLPMGDGHSPNARKIPEVIASLNEIPTYIHCLHGKDRTGMFCAMYRILKDGWGEKEALAEAAKFGMGDFLSPSTKKSYYDAVKKIGADKNKSEDAATISREETPSQPSPGANNYFDVTQPSWAPFLDGENDWKNRPAARKIQFLKLAQSIGSPFIYKRSEDYVWIGKDHTDDGLWYKTPERASAANPKGDLYKATIAKSAKVVVHNRPLNKDDIRIDIVQGPPDVIVFSDKIYVLNQMKALEQIEIIEDAPEDVNNLPEVGEWDNYQGNALNSFPGSGGSFLDGGTGSAGFTQLPNTNF